MDNQATFVDMVKVDGERYDVWQDDSDRLYVSEFAEDNLKPLPDRLREQVEEQLDL